MKQFTFSIAAALLTLPAILLNEHLAVSPTTPTYTHLIYMFAHANILHWAINAYALIVMHKFCTPAALTAAYICAVAISFLPIYTQPTLGMSVMIYFLIAKIITQRKNKAIILPIAIFIVAGFFLPNIAAAFHLAAISCGTIYFIAEKNIKSFIQFTNT